MSLVDESRLRAFVSHEFPKVREDGRAAFRMSVRDEAL